VRGQVDGTADLRPSLSGNRGFFALSAQTAPTQFVEANGIRFAYRRFGKASGVPLVFNMHFTGTMDHWDPLVTDGFAKDREVILFDNAGISSSSGEVPTSVEGMAANAIAFIKKSGGRIIMIGSAVGERAVAPGLVAYSGTKAAVKMFTQALSREVGKRGITVNKRRATGQCLKRPQRRSTAMDMSMRSPHWWSSSLVRSPRTLPGRISPLMAE